MSGNLAFTQLGQGTLLPFQGVAAGAGMNVTGGATASVVKSTFDSNTAVAGDGSGSQLGGEADGGALFVSNGTIDGSNATGGRLEVTNTTISNNIAKGGANGGRGFGGGITLR